MDSADNFLASVSAVTTAMIVFDSQKRAPVAVSGRTLRFQQDIQRFLADSMYYFDLPANQLDDLVTEAAAPAPASSPYPMPGEVRQS